MRSSTIIAGLAAIAVPTLAQRPANESICDYYTTALLKENTGANQLTLLTLLVNTVVIGNYTQPNVGVAVPGILAKGMVNGTEVNLLPYFNGALESTNDGGSKGISVNFLDGGGAAPLMMNMPANGTTSNQYMLLTHLYQYFGVLLGCSASGFPSYKGDKSQASVHRFMDLSPYEVGYFIQQVGLAAASFGVATADIEAVAMSLNSIFNVRCAPPTTVIPAQGAQLQSICEDETCPLAPNATCAAYPSVFTPANATSPATGMMGNGTATMTASPTFTGAAAKAGVGAAGLLALAAMVL